MKTAGTLQQPACADTRHPACPPSRPAPTTTQRDAYEVCSLIPDPSERSQCYSVFGLDAGRMSAYYDTVCRLESQLASDLDSPGESL